MRILPIVVALAPGALGWWSLTVPSSGPPATSTAATTSDEVVANVHEAAEKSSDCRVTLRRPSRSQEHVDPMSPVIRLMSEALGAKVDEAPVVQRSAGRSRQEQERETQLAAFRARANGSVTVEFVIATIPDYVDSQMGWRADAVIGAIQSAMGAAGFSLDRFTLIEASVRPGDSAPVVARSHESQPGAIIFRRLKDAPAGADASSPKVEWRVVLLVLETPTGGIHRASLENAIDFILEWKVTTLRILGPTFSGSIDSLRSTLVRYECRFQSINVVSGSALGPTNLKDMHDVVKTVSYSATVVPSSEMTRHAVELVTLLAGTVTRRPTAWLVEGNTTYGQSGISVAGEKSDALDIFFRFPLHVAQLSVNNDDTTVKTFLPLAATSRVLPLKLGDAQIATDQIVPLAPQLTTPTVATILRGTLDYMRSLRVATVAIIATDERDVLFLAREVRLTLPDVQLVIFGAHRLYLHPDYLPYTRGAIVFSSYPLALDARQGSGRVRQLAGSMTVEGVYNATLLQLGRQDLLLDYLPREAAATVSGGNSDATMASAPPTSRSGSGANPGASTYLGPAVWASVIGNGAFWPVQRWAGTDEVLAPVLLPRGELQPVVGPSMSTGALVFAIALALCIALHVGASVYVWTQTGSRARHTRLMRIALVWTLASPWAHPEVKRFHRLSLGILFSTLALVAAAEALVVMLHITGRRNEVASRMWPALAAVAAAVLVGVSYFLLTSRGRTLQSMKDPGWTIPREPHRWVLTGIVLGLFIATGGFLVTYLAETIGLDDVAMGFWAARATGGGFVSPAVPVLLLGVASYVIWLASIRRLSLVGLSYTLLSQDSSCFRLLTGFPAGSRRLLTPHAPPSDEMSKDYRHFVGMLDLPLHNLPKVYVCAVLVWLLVASWVLGWRVYTVDGAAFSSFLLYGSLAGLGSGLLLAAQAAELWRVMQPKLRRLDKSELHEAFSTVGGMVRWNLSFVPTRSSEMKPVVTMIDRLRQPLLQLEPFEGPRKRRRAIDSLGSGTTSSGSAVSLRRTDLDMLASSLDKAPTVDEFSRQIANSKYLPLLQSRTWVRAWRLSDTLVGVLEQTWWRRQPARGRIRSGRDPRTSWFVTAEHVVALQMGFVIRDMLARVMWSLFTAMACLIAVAGAHLFYVFEGRATLLRLDLIAIVATGAAGLWVLLGIERDAVISALRNTTAGRVNFSWELAARVATYGVIPLVALIATLFPEVAGPLFGWIEPLRNLVVR